MRRPLAALVVLLAAVATVSSAVAAPALAVDGGPIAGGQLPPAATAADAAPLAGGQFHRAATADGGARLAGGQLPPVADSRYAGAPPADPVRRQTEAPPDPDSDVQGWEGGYWYNESLAVTNDDGLNRTELEAVVARAMARVEYLRDVEFETTVPVEVVTRAEYTRRYGAANNTSAALRTFDNAKMEALFLIGEDEDSIAVQNQNRNSSVLGFYTPQDDQIIVVSEGDTPQMAELTLGHELVHAYQDQAFNLSRYDSRTRDALNGRNGIIEGDANYVEHLYSLRCGTEWECVETTGGSGGGQLANIGVYLMKFQPYSDGPKFVKTIRDRGGWDAVDAVYTDVPESSEQVIHPEKYGEDPPTNVSLADATDGSWERVRPPDRPDAATVGEAGLSSTFVYPLYHSEGSARIVDPSEWLNQSGDGLSSFDPLNYANPYSSGWDGDRLHVYRNADDETAYVWRLVWDSPAEATEFYDGYQQVLSYWGAEQVGADTYRIESGGFADAFHVDVEGDTVTVVNAPTVEDLSAVRTDVEVTTPTPTPTATATPTATTEPTGESTPTDPIDGGGIPGFGTVAAVVALLGAALLVTRRRP